MASQRVENTTHRRREFITKQAIDTSRAQVECFISAEESALMELLQEDFHWNSLVVMLNTLLAQYKKPSRIEAEQFPSPAIDDFRPFPEDFALRGLLWAEDYFPQEWFTHENIDEEEKHHERPSMTDERKERMLWLACRIAKAGPWIQYNGTSFKAQKDAFFSQGLVPVATSNA